MNKTKQISSGVLVGILSGCLLTPVHAATNNNIEANLARLEKEVASLKKQVNAKKTNTKTVAPPTNAASVTAAKNQKKVDTVQAVDDGNLHFQQYLPFDPDVPGQAYVSSGPYVGVKIQFAGNNLIVNSPSVNTDLQLLVIRKNIINQLNATLGESGIQPTHSHVLLSGVIEGQANYTNHGGAPSTTDIDVTNVSLDTTILGPSDWLLGYVELSYNNNAPIGDVFVSTSNYRVSNSRVYVNKAFVTIGNLTCSPFYFTFGQFYAPFGTYSTVMVSDPLTRLMARTKVRALQLGFAQQSDNAFYASAYIFRGDSHENSVAKVRNGGINIGYKFDLGFLTGNIGGGVIANIADSGGMQFGVNFQEFEQLVHRVPAYDLRAAFNIGQHLDLIAEYIVASSRFSPLDMSFNNHGAKPGALDLEAAFSFSLFDRPSSIGIGYGNANQLLAMELPNTRKFIVFNTSWWRNTLQSLEFRVDRQYASSAVATGAGGFEVEPQEGKLDRAITAQFDYYF